MPGYDRQTATSIGAGAQEIIQTLVEHTPEEDSLRFGSVLQPYERSAYLTVRSDLTESLPFRGPRLILLGGRDISGPLTLEVDNRPPGGFEPGGIEADLSCQVRMGTTRRREDVGYVLGVGDTVEVTIDQRLLEAETSGLTHVRDLSEIERGSPAWRDGRETLDWLLDSQLSDGLGWTPRLDASLNDEARDGELKALAAGWHRIVTAGVDGDLPSVISDVIGRGPGATPSGDDILSGILLTLLHTTTGEEREHVLAAGDKLVATATDRTTTISTALLAQASLGRSPDSVTEAIRSLLQPSVSRGSRDAAIRALTDRGHTSGVDILVGILLTSLLIGPDL